MYTLITIFYVSFAGIVGLILAKRHEVETGKPSIVSKIGAGSDHIFHNIFASVRQAVSYVNRHTFIAIAQWISFHILVRVRKVYIEVKHRSLHNPHTKKVVDAVRGKGEVKKHGVSFYLRKIGDK